MNPKPAIYKAEVSAPSGQFLFAVESLEMDARSDILTAALTEFNCPAGMLRVRTVSKSTRRLIDKMSEIKKCRLPNSKNCWAWVKRSSS